MSAITADGVLAIWNDCVPGREADYEAWYQGEHLIERLAVPGFLFGRRLEAISGAPKYFTIYVTETTEVLTSAPYIERLNNPTPLTQLAMSELFKNMSRTNCRRTARVGCFRGSMVTTLRFSDLPDRLTLMALIETLVRNPAVACAELWQAVDLDKVAVATEERLRGGDKKIGGCLVVETLRQREAEDIAFRLSRQFPHAETGVYRTLCQLGSDDL